MLRKSLMILGLALVLAGAFGWFGGWSSGFMAIPGGILLLALLGERYVYKPVQTDAPGAGWERTEEMFTDPTTGQTLTVWFDPSTGKRVYVAADGSRREG